MKLKFIGTAAIAIMVLAACGGHHNDDSSASNASPASSIRDDAFLSQVDTVISATDETSEPKSIDAVTATTPETNEAAPLI